MAQEADSEPVAPRPGLLRAIGFCHLVFGTLLSLFGAACLFILVPFLVENHPFQVDPVLADDGANEIRREMVASLRRRASTVTSPAETRRLTEARAEMESVRIDLAGQIDLAKVNADLPWISRYLWINILSAPALNFLMIFAGMGLVWKRNWGRALAIGTAVLKLARLIVLAALLALVVVPSTADVADRFGRTDFGRAFIKHARDQQGPSLNPFATANINFTPEELVRIIAACGYGYAAIAAALGAIYPAATLLVLSRPGARAACVGPRQ